MWLALAYDNADSFRRGPGPSTWAGELTRSLRMASLKDLLSKELLPDGLSYSTTSTRSLEMSSSRGSRSGMSVSLAWPSVTSGVIREACCKVCVS